MSKVYNDFLERIRVTDEDLKKEEERKKKQEAKSKKTKTSKTKTGTKRKIKGARGTARKNEEYQEYYHKKTAEEFDIPGERSYVYNRKTGRYEEVYNDGRDIDD